MTSPILEGLMSQNDVLGLNNEYDRWLKERTLGLVLPRGATHFDLFCAEQILKPHVLLSDQDILSGLVGKGNDGGIDGFYFVLNGQLVQESTETTAQPDQSVHLVIIQTKEGQGFSANSVEKFDTFSDDLLDLTKTPELYGRVYHDNLKDKMRIFKEKYNSLSLPKTTIDYFYVTKQDVLEDQGSQTAARKVIATARRQMPKATVNELNFLNAARLYTLIGIRPPKTKTLSFVEVIDITDGWIGAVPLSEFNSFLKTENGERNDSMFDDNVRGFQRETTVNDAIQKTLSEPEKSPEFWLLNNGVTILSSNVQPKSAKRLEITDPQIVNGLQTSRQVFAYYASGKLPENDKRRIVIRVIQNNDEGVRDQIIRATNNQNPMPAEALFTTFRIHKQIETVFLGHGLFYERRKGFYRDQKKPISKIVTPQELIPAVVAIMTDQPHDARSRPGSYIQENEKRWRLFGHDDFDDSNITADKEITENPPFDISVYLNCVLLVRRVDEFLENRPRKLDAESIRNIRFYLAKYAACAAIQNAHCPPGKISKLDIAQITDDFLEKHFKQVRRIYRSHGANDIAGRSPKMSVSLVRHLRRTFSPSRKKV